MGVSTFGLFTQARLGIYASQMGMSVTGNNISNINTSGYTRQRLEQASFYNQGAERYYSSSARTGNGVRCTNVSQLRDPYLDIRYRSEMSSVGAMDAKLAGLENIQAVLDEVGDGDEAFGILEAQFSTLYDALQQLSDQTGHAEYDILVRSSAESLVKQMNSYASKLEEVYNNAVSNFNQDLETVNTILSRIQELNVTIRKNEIHGDNSLELKDERNVLLDQLSEYMKVDITYTTEDIGAGQTVEKLVVKLGNANPDDGAPNDEAVLIDGIYARQFMLDKTMPRENPNYDPEDDASFPYLKADGTGTKDPAEADQVANTNFNLSLDALRDVNGKVMYSITGGNEEELTTDTDNDGVPDGYPDDGKATTNTDEATGEQTIITYRKVLQGLTKNDRYDPAQEATGTNLPYLDKDGKPATKDDAARIYAYYATTYKKTPSKVEGLDDNDLYGALQSQREFLTESGEFASATTVHKTDENAATKRGVQYYQKSLDLLANQFAKVFNDINQGCVYNEKGEYVDKDGNVLKLNGETVSKNGLTDAQKTWLNDNNTTLDAWLKANGDWRGNPMFSTRSDTDNTEGITASNISISASWAAGNNIVSSFLRPTGMDIATTDSSNIEHLIYSFTQKRDFIPGDVDADATTDEVMFNGTFQEMWVNMGTVLGNDMSVTTTMLDTYYSSSVDLNTSRDSVSSVDLNDEAMNLMQYSKSYNAACRLMTTIDSILDKLINGTGMTT